MNLIGNVYGWFLVGVRRKKIARKIRIYRAIEVAMIRKNIRSPTRLCEQDLVRKFDFACDFMGLSVDELAASFGVTETDKSTDDQAG